MLAGSFVLFALVMGLFALACCGRASAARCRRSAGSCSAGWRLPAVVLVPLVAYGLVAGERLLPLPGMNAAAHRGAGRTMGLDLPLSGPRRERPPRACCTCPPACRWTSWSRSRDVIHSLWIPRLAGKIDVDPRARERRCACRPTRPGATRAVRRVLRPGHARHALRGRRASGRRTSPPRWRTPRPGAETKQVSAPAEPTPKAAARCGCTASSPRSGPPGRGCSAWPRSTTR